MIKITEEQEKHINLFRFGLIILQAGLMFKGYWFLGLIPMFIVITIPFFYKVRKTKQRSNDK